MCLPEFVYVQNPYTMIRLAGMRDNGSAQFFLTLGKPRAFYRLIFSDNKPVMAP